MYFTDTPELRKLEREMKQKPNFDRHNDDFSENGEGHRSTDIQTDFEKKHKDGG